MIIGGLPQGPITFSDSRFAFNEIKVTGIQSRRATDVGEVLQMAKDGRIDVKRLITKKYAFTDINESLSDLEHGRLLMGITLWN